MKRRAHLIFSSLDTVKINTSFIVQKSFHIPSMPKYGGIDLINLRVVSNTKGLPFFACKYSENDAWDLHRRGLLDYDDMEALDQLDNVLVVWGITDAHGNKEPIGCVCRGCTTYFEVYVP